MKQNAPTTAVLDEVHLVLDMLLWNETEEGPKKAAHRKLLAARKEFLEKATPPAWERCVEAARKFVAALKPVDPRRRPPPRLPPGPSKIGFNPMDPLR